MSLGSPDREFSRRACLGAAVAAGVAVTAWPTFSRAECPCPGDVKVDEHPKLSAAEPVVPAPIKSLRVCADPNNLPFSNREHEGFEDKIAAIIAKDLGLPLEYDFLPQRLGFYRTALKTFDSNLVMAAPAGFDKALVTDPYYRSTYVFVTRKDAKTQIKSFDDPALRTLKIGVQLTGGDNAPPTHALIKRKLIDNVNGFPVFDESDGKPAEKIIAAVVNGEVDVAIVWGPQGGYFAKRQTVPLDLTPVAPAEDVMGDVKMQFTFEICMALRKPDKELRAKINGVIAKRQREINQILDDYGIPRLALRQADAGTAFGPSEQRPQAERSNTPAERK